MSVSNAVPLGGWLVSFNFIGVWLIYNVVLVSGVQQSGSVIPTSIFFFSHIGYYKLV